MDVAAKAEFLEAKGIHVPILEGPVMPLEVVHVWEWFQALCSGRGGGFGPAPISWADMYGFFSLHGIEVRDWELSLLRVFDAAWFEANQEGKKDD